MKDYKQILENAKSMIEETKRLELEDFQTPARATQTNKLRGQARKAWQAAGRKLDALQDMEWDEINSPDTYGTKGKVVKPTKKMLKTRASAEKAKETKRMNAAKKYREWDNARKEIERNNLKTSQGRAIRAASIAQGQRNDLGW